MTYKRLVLILSLVCLLVGCFSGCTDTPQATTPPETPTEAIVETTPVSNEIVDYASSVKLDSTSGTAQQKVTVKTFVDGDTTHFYVPSSVMDTGVLKARYLAINTPESTGKIEEYGKKASAFTREKLESASSIIIESDTATWDADSTGGRYLVWIWYRTNESEDYRNLNIEILQNGLAIASNSANNRYGDTCIAAINQAKAQKLNLHSGEKDPDFFYGEAIELTLKELRTNIEDYNGMKVAFNGVVTVNDNNSVYVEDFDPESGIYYGMSVYYGYNLNGQGLDIISVGNKVRIVGSVQYYEAGGTYQVSDLNYRLMKPDDPGNIQKISEGNEPGFMVTDPKTFADGQITILTEEGEITESYAAMVMNSSVEMQGLRVVDIYTTTNEESASKGAMTLVCDANGTRISVRTTVLYDENGKLVTADAYRGRTINVRGIVDYFNGNYQIKVFSKDAITITN